MKLLHTADWQIGKPFGGFEPDDAVLLTAARIETVKEIAAVAAREACDAVLVAGDVFDAQTVSDKTIHQTFSALGAFSGPWVFLPGNHDAALVESVWSRAKRLGAIPPNAILCLTPEPTSLLDGKAVILPAPLTQRNTYEDVTQWFASHESPAGVIRIGLAHGSVQGILPDTIDSPNPIAQGRAEEARLDYLALGDWHGMKCVDARTWYSGTPETDRFSSIDPGHVLIVEIRAGQEPGVNPIPIGRHPWVEVDHRITVPSDIDNLDNILVGAPEHAVLSVKVSGSTDLASQARIRATIARAQGRARALRFDLSGLQVLPSQEDLDALRADGYLADTIAQLRQEQETGSDPALARDALVLLATTMRSVGTQEAQA